MVDNCLNRLEPRNTIVTSNIKNNVNFVGGHLFVDGHEISNSYPGLINHTSEEGNQIFAKEIIKLINETLLKPEYQHLSKWINGMSVSPKKNFCIIKIWLDVSSLQDPNIIIDIPNLHKLGCLFKKHEPEF